MDIVKIKEAKKEALRFIERVDALIKANAENPWTNPKEHGAVRRSSMDLTRSLAEMRKPSN